MLAKLLVPLLLLTLLLDAAAARADSMAPATSPVVVEEAEFEFEEGEEESPQEECEEATEEFEEGEIDREELEEGCERQRKRSAHGEAPEECILRSAHAHAVINAKSSTLKLTLGYTTYEPASATIDIGKGAAHIASLHRQLHRSGVIRTVESLPGAGAPRRIVVSIDLPSVESAGCPSRRLVLFPR